MARKTVIEGTDVTASQLKEFFAQIASGAITRSVLQGVLSQVKKTIILATFVTANYFITRSGLFVSGGFTSQITAAYPEALVPRGLEGVKSFDLASNSSDKKILDRPEMGGEENMREHAVTPDQIADLINLQPEGMEGRLLNDGGANLFYVVGKSGKLFVVIVHWSGGRRKWRVNAWELVEDDCWHAGYRVFRNTQVLKA
jgi:hypothetical protein